MNRDDLRDLFAAAALIGQLSNQKFLESYSEDYAADRAYLFANAMMRSRLPIAEEGDEE